MPPSLSISHTLLLLNKAVTFPSHHHLLFFYGHWKPPRFPRVGVTDHNKGSNNPRNRSNTFVSVAVGDMTARGGRGRSSGAARSAGWVEIGSGQRAQGARGQRRWAAGGGAESRWRGEKEVMGGTGEAGMGGEFDGGKKKQEQQQEQETVRLLTLPTVLTLGRVAAVPLLVSTFYMDAWWATTATTSIFLGAAITDWLDGYIARKMRLKTAFGAFLDPVADKLMVATTLILLCTETLEIPMFGEVSWLLAVPSIAIIGREITMSAVREWAASQSSGVLEAVAVNNLGKWKTATQMTALTILLATRDSSMADSRVIAASGVVLLYISAGLAIWSLIVYMRNIWRVLLK